MTHFYPSFVCRWLSRVSTRAAARAELAGLRACGLLVLFITTPLLAHAQAPTVTTLSPTRNLRNAAASSNVAVTFSQTMQNTTATQQAVRVFSQQRGGRMFGSTRGVASVSGSTITFNPTTDFRPGETVLVTTTTAATSTGGAVLARGHVHQFTAAVGGTGGGNFTAPVTNPDPAVGDKPADVAVGDVDNDGDLDLVTANYNANTASVRLNNGTGNFTAPATNPNPAVGTSPYSVVLGDVDGDGDLDLLTANYTAPGTVSVRLNDGTGNFTPPATNPNPSVGNGAFSIAVGDIDGDGDLDLLTTSYLANTVSVRLNDGTGNFTPPATNPNPSVGTNPVSLTLGDVDGDGDLDLLTANDTPNTVSVRLNNGTGNFTAPATNPEIAVGTAPKCVIVGDVDGDGDLDLVTANLSGNTVSVRLNNGTGNFTPPATNPNPAIDDSSYSVALGDVDGDGDLDLIASNYVPNTVNVRLNNGTGNFTPPATNATFAVGFSPTGVALGDVDNDGDLDLLTANNATPNGSVSVRLNQPPLPTLTGLSPTSGLVGTVVTLTGTNFTGATSVRFNGTTATGFTVVSATSITATVPVGATTGNVTVTTPGGTSNGVSFTVTLPPLIITALAPTRNLRNAPVGSNVAVTFDAPMQNSFATQAAVRVFSQQRGGRMFGNTRGVASVSGSTVTFNPTTDFRPGETVLVTTTTAATATSGAVLAGGRVHQFTTAVGGAGRGNFQLPTVNPNPTAGINPSSVALGDVDNDGDLDYVVANDNSLNIVGGHTISVRLNNGAGNFTAPATTPDVAVGNNPNGVALGDLDGDGDLDFVSANYGSNTVSVRFNNGSGTFSGGSDPAMGTNPYAIALADLDGDGDLDLACSNLNGGSVSIRLNNGAGAFSGSQNVSTAGSPYYLALGDVDSDGDVDLLVANYASNVIVRLNDGTGQFSGTTTVAVGSGVTAIALGDLDADGDLDFATSNYLGNSVSVRLNNGSGSFSGSTELTGITSAYGLALGDVDADGDLDLLTPNYVITGTVTVRLNNGTAGFSAPAANPTPGINGSRPNSLALGDLDGDGDLDLIATPANNSYVSVLLNQEPPTITNLSPGSGPVGTVVTLTGTNFTGATSVRFNGTTAPGFTVGSATSITATVPTGATTGNVTVTTPGGTSNGVSFTVIQPPTITSLSALLGPEGTTVVVSGTNLTGATSVAFNGTNAPGFVVNSATSITATVPVGATSGTLRVMTPGGTATSAATFTVLPIFSGTFNQCLSTTSITSTGSGTWQYLRAANGNLVAALNDQGTALGTVSVDFWLNQGAVRDDGSGREYLDRNWKLTAQNAFAGQSVRVRFYARNSEFTAYTAGNDGDANDVTSLAQLRLTQYRGANEDCLLSNNAWATAEVRLLTPTNTEAISGANWFALETIVPDHFSEFFLNGGLAPLPVELVRFGAKRTAPTQVSLAWQTASEKNNRGYIVQRSTNGTDFAAISDLVPGHGTSLAPQTYEFTDESAPAALLYYRLLQVDYDGTSTYSSIVAVQPTNLTTDNPQLALFPNPTHGGLVRVSELGGATEVQVLDATGRAVATSTESTIDTRSLPAGVYTVRTTGGRTTRLVVE